MKEYRKEDVEKRYPIGAMVKLVFTNDPYTKLKPGDTGHVSFIDDACQIHISWDNGSSLAMIPGVDKIVIVED